MAEKRRHERRDLEVDVEITLDDWHAAKLTRTANVSPGGMYVLLRDPPPVGSIVKFEMKLSDGDVHGIGRVTWIRLKTDTLERPTGMGLEFRTIFDDGEKRLKQACALATQARELAE